LETALYYTLSTIAQTLAGALAVLVAFTLFRLPGIEEVIGRGQALLRQHRAVPYNVSWPIVRDQGWEAFAKSMTKEEDFLTGNAEAQQILHGAQYAWRYRSRVTSALYLALGFTVADIAICFVALPITRHIACSRSATVIVLSFAVGLGIICLLLYVRLITAIVGRPAAQA